MMRYLNDEAVKNGILDEEELRWAKKAGLDVEVSDVWRLESSIFIIDEKTREVKVC